MYWCTSDTLLTKSLNLRVHNKSRERERHDVVYLGLDLRTATQPQDCSAKNLTIPLLLGEPHASRTRHFAVPEPSVRLAAEPLRSTGVSSLASGPLYGALCSRGMGDGVLARRAKRDIARCPPECFCKCRRLIGGRRFSGIEEAL